VNSVEPTGISGGALVDAGNLADPANLAPNAPCRGMLAGMLIEHHARHKAIVAIRIDSILRALWGRSWL
jgi:hypothetical protein